MLESLGKLCQSSFKTLSFIFHPLSTESIVVWPLLPLYLWTCFPLYFWPFLTLYFHVKVLRNVCTISGCFQKHRAVVHDMCYFWKNAPDSGLQWDNETSNSLFSFSFFSSSSTYFCCIVLYVAGSASLKPLGVTSPLSTFERKHRDLNEDWDRCTTLDALKNQRW